MAVYSDQALNQSPVLQANNLMQGDGALAGEGNLIDLGHELGGVTLLVDDQSTVLDMHLGTRIEGAGEDDRFGAGSDVDKTTGSGGAVRCGTQPGHVHGTLGIDLEEAQHGCVEPAGLEVGELVR